MSDEEDNEEDTPAGLVMPYVSCVSRGGPHDDESYVCGYEMGELDARLKYEQPDQLVLTIHTENVEQADLIAMLHGYKAEKAVTDYPEWTFMRLTKLLYTN